MTWQALRAHAEILRDAAILAVGVEQHERGAGDEIVVHRHGQASRAQARAHRSNPVGEDQGLVEGDGAVDENLRHLDLRENRVEADERRHPVDVLAAARTEDLKPVVERRQVVRAEQNDAARGQAIADQLPAILVRAAAQVVVEHDTCGRGGELRQREVVDVVFATTRLKTGSLMELAAELGATAAGADAESTAELAALGAELGVALQMLDDLTGVCVERRRVKGKEDLVQGRPTWVWAWLAERSDRLSYLRFRSVLEAVQRGEFDALLLAEQLSEQIGEVGRTAIRERLNTTLERVKQRFAGIPALSELEREFERLEAYGG